MDFQTWYNEVDMPEVVDGKWVDLETGIPFIQVYVKKAAIVKHKDAGLKLPELKSKVERLAKSAQISLDRSEVELPVTQQFIVESAAALAAKPKKADLIALIDLNSEASREQNLARNS